MGLYKAQKIYSFLVLLLIMLAAIPSFAQYACFKTIEERKGDEPLPMAILWSEKNQVALVRYRDQILTVFNRTRLDNEWHVKEIKRDRVIFGRESEKRFIEYQLNAPKKVRYHHDWSFFGQGISLWEAIELLITGFGNDAVMHYRAGGAVIPGNHGHSLMNLMKPSLPENMRAVLENGTLYVLPKELPEEGWADIMKRRLKFNHKSLQIRFPTLEKEGTVVSHGDDIQYILRVISLGGKVPIAFPKNLHFPVYASFSDISFSKILCDIAFINQCSVVEREKCLDIVPWRALPKAINSNPDVVKKFKITENGKEAVSRYAVNVPYIMRSNDEDYIMADPERYDEISGSGPYPPPLIGDPEMFPSKVRYSLPRMKMKE